MHRARRYSDAIRKTLKRLIFTFAAATTWKAFSPGRRSGRWFFFNRRWTGTPRSRWLTLAWRPSRLRDCTRGRRPRPRFEDKLFQPLRRPWRLTTHRPKHSRFWLWRRHGVIGTGRARRRGYAG